MKRIVREYKHEDLADILLAWESASKSQARNFAFNNNFLRDAS